MSFLKKGKEKEENFATILGSVNYSNREDDINKHWDLEFEGIKYDVKGLKKLKRSDVYPNEFFHYIELRNVLGKLGWLYGEADCFAFEINKYWVIVDKIKLQNFIKENVIKQEVNNPDECLYCLYTRSGRKDVITMVKTIDLMLLSDNIIDKKVDIIEHEIGESVIEDIRIKNRITKLNLNKNKSENTCIIKL